MSHFTVLVIGDNFEEQLAPYNEQNEQYFSFVDKTKEVLETWENGSLDNKSIKEYYDNNFDEFLKDYFGYTKIDDKYGYHANPNAKWDWYQVGGRWSNFFKLKEDKNGEAKYVDVIYKKDIDIDAMKKDAENTAAKTYDKLINVFGGSIPKLDIEWETLLDDKSISIDEKRSMYHNQTAIQQLKKVSAEYSDKMQNSDEDHEMWLFLSFLDLEDFQCSKNEYIERQKNGVLTTFAFLKDGIWCERGNMGWFGVALNEAPLHEWNKKFMEMFNSLSDDTLITLVDCHI